MAFLNRGGDRIFSKKQTPEDMRASALKEQPPTRGPLALGVDAMHLRDGRPGSHRLIHRYTDMKVGIRPVHNSRYNHPMTGANQ